MSSKTFKTNAATRHRLEVHRGKASVYFEIRGGRDFFNFNLAPSDAPALALAILEAAKHDMGSEVSLAMEYLERYTKAVTEKESEAKEQAELEAEALELFNAQRESHVLPACANWDEIHPLRQEQWLAVARRAREMRNEKKVTTDD